MAIRYDDKTEYAGHPCYRTPKFGNLLSDTLSGEVDSFDGVAWSGWATNHSNESRSEVRLGFGSRAAAARWVNAMLRDWGVR